VGEPERLDGRRVSANLFDVLGVQPRLGRGFLPQEDTPGTHVAILSHGLWQRRFGSDPRIIGQALNLNGESYSVVVVMPPGAHVPMLRPERAAVRQQEIALRRALGASRSRLTRQFLTESVLLATLGASVGLIFAIAGLRILKAFIPDTISQADSIGIDAKVLLFTALVALITGLIFGLAPAAQVSNFNLNETLNEGGRGAAEGSKGARLRGLLVIAEVAVSLVLLIGAGLVLRSFLPL